MTILNADALDKLLTDMRDRQLNLIETKENVSVTYYTPEKKKIRVKKVYDKGKKLLSESRYRYDTGGLEEKVIYEYDENSTKKSKPKTRVKL
jgi:hypothetical protein